MAEQKILLILLCLTFFSYYISKNKVKNLQNATNNKLNSLSNYYGYFVVICSALPAFILLAFWSFLENSLITMAVVSEFSEISSLPKDELSLVLNKITAIAENSALAQDYNQSLYIKAADLITKYQINNSYLKTITVFLVFIIGFLLSYTKIGAKFTARKKVEKTIIFFLMLSALIAILTTAGIIFSVLFESIAFFKQIPFFDFILGTHWSPQIAIREDQISSSGGFGAVPLFWGTILISLIAIIVAAPLVLISAIYLSEYASVKFKNIAKPVLEILAGIPTVVYGFFAAITIGPFMKNIADKLNQFGINFDIHLFADFTISSESAIAAGLVMGMMIMPFILSLSDDVISAVPNSLREASTAIGATKSETIWRVIFPAALPGIISSILLAISRAIGETMIVLMAAGIAANLTINPFDAVTTVTTQIVVLLTGDQEFDSVKTLSAFALALGLFIITLIFNIIALKIVRKYREQYE